MDIDKSFIHSLLVKGESGYKTAIERGVDPDQHLNLEAKKAWDFIKNHRLKYGTMPSLDIAKALLDLDLGPPPTDHINSLIDALFKRRVNWVIRDGIESVTKKLEQQDPLSGAEQWNEIHRKLLNEKLTTSKVESLFDYVPQVIQAYDDAKMGKRGIPTPWPTMDEQTLGWQPEDLVLFVARLGMGKTWSLLLTSYTAWENDTKVLIATTEMRSSAMAMRLLALHFRLNYGDFRRGRLGEFVEQEFKAKAMDMVKEKGLYIVGGGFDFTIDNLEAAIDQNEPNMVSIDGAYLIKNKGKDRNEKVANTFDDLKRLAKRKQIACIANTQFNRSAKKDADTITAENIGMTDVAGWNSDAIYGLWKDKAMEDLGEAGIKAIKVREGRPKDFKIKWDLDRMDFSEMIDQNDVFAMSSQMAITPAPMAMNSNTQPTVDGTEDDDSPY